MDNLGRVLDPTALDSSTGPSARIEVCVPPAWRGQTIDLVLPVRVTCSRCDGGGCDSCGRGGAFRLPRKTSQRRFSLQLPGSLSQGVRLRLPQPLGAAGPLEILLIHIEVANQPSSCVSLASPGPVQSLIPRARLFQLVALAVVLGLVTLVLLNLGP